MKSRRHKTLSRCSPDSKQQRHILNRVLSTTAGSRKISQYNDVRENMYNKINSIRPYSHIQRVENVEENLQTVIDLHKSTRDFFQSLKISDFDKIKQKNMDKKLKKRCEDIIKIKNKCRLNKEFIQKHRYKGTSDNKDDVQNDIAFNLINQYSKDKTQHRNTLQKFRLKIKQAHQNYLKRIQDQTFLMRNVSKCTNKISNDLEENYQKYSKSQNKRQNSALTINKKDVYTYLKFSNRIINSQSITNQSMTTQIQLKNTIGNSPTNKKRKQFYLKYNQSRKQRKKILRSPMSLCP